MIPGRAYHPQCFGDRIQNYLNESSIHDASTEGVPAEASDNEVPENKTEPVVAETEVPASQDIPGLEPVKNETDSSEVKEEATAEGDKATKAEVKTEDVATQEKSEVKAEKAADDPKTEEGTEVKTEIKGEEEVVKDEPKDLDTSLTEEAPLTDMKPPPTVAAPSLGSGFVINISR